MVSRKRLRILIEVKTTDTYRVNLDRISGYAEKLKADNRIPAQVSTLVVVGRQDTGDLEAQIRGSKYAWGMRLISVEALVKLVQVRERAEELSVRKIHDLLTPFEYTKLDRIVDVVFDVSEEADILSQEDGPPTASDSSPVVKSPTRPEETDIGITRRRIVDVLSRRLRPLVRKSGALYWSTDKSVRVAIAVSSRYEHRGWPYWYMYRPQWDAFLNEAAQGFYVLGCVDLEVAYVIPFEKIHSWLTRLRTTNRNGRFYWHVDLDAERGKEKEARFRLVEPRTDEDLGRFVQQLA